MLPASKAVLAVNQSSTATNGTAAGNIDTLGFDFCDIDVIMATSNAVSNNPSLLKVMEGTTTDATNFTNISGFVGDTDFTIPNSITAATSITGPFAKFRVDCRGLERYLRVECTPLTTQVITVIGNLHRGEELPITASEAGASVLVEG